MKKLTFMLLLVLAVTTVFGQRGGRRGSLIKWLSLSANAGVGNSILLNSATMNDIKAEYNYFTPSNYIGGKFGITVGDYVGLFVEAASSSFGQEYTIEGNSVKYAKKLRFNTTDFTVLLRAANDYGMWIEAGPKFSMVKKVTETNTPSESVTSPAVMSDFVSKFNSITVGAGFALFRSDRVEVNTGLRFNYALEDIVTNYMYPLDDGSYVMPTGDYGETKPLTIQAVIELKYFFGFWGDASCGRGNLMFFQ
ncbi:MAG TPA: hypothetical protein DCQ31_12530 [Bacteroidales bacterium]|nr:hypothetical protein [Bacteroidales bacterium]